MQEKIIEPYVLYMEAEEQASTYPDFITWVYKAQKIKYKHDL